MPLELLFQMPAIRVLSSERSLLLSGRTVLPQENWKEEEGRGGGGGVGGGRKEKITKPRVLHCIKTIET